VRDCIEESLADRRLVEGQNVVAKESFLVALAVVAKIDLLPKRLLEKEKPSRYSTRSCAGPVASEERYSKMTSIEIGGDRGQHAYPKRIKAA